MDSCFSTPIFQEDPELWGHPQCLGGSITGTATGDLSPFMVRDGRARAPICCWPAPCPCYLGAPDGALLTRSFLQVGEAPLAVRTEPTVCHSPAWTLFSGLFGHQQVYMISFFAHWHFFTGPSVCQEQRWAQ